MSELRLFGYPTRLVVDVDGVELDVTHAIAPADQRVDLEAILVAVRHHRQGTPPPRPLPDPNPSRVLELTPEAQRQGPVPGWWPGGRSPQ